MRRRMMKSKIHRATVTDADLHYVGSITLDPRPDGRWPTSSSTSRSPSSTSTTAPASRPTPSPAAGSGDVCLNGAAARLVQPGDRVIVITYADYEEAELDGYEPHVVHVDTANRPVRRQPASRRDAGPER